MNNFHLATEDYKDNNKNRWVRLAKRILVIVAGYVIIRLTIKIVLRDIMDESRSLWFALLLAYLLIAYITMPILIRLYNKYKDHRHVPHRTRTGDGLLGDPLNIALVGSKKKIEAAMKSAGWYQADKITITSAIAMMRSVVLKKSYPSAPVSNLYLNGNKPDLVFQQEIGGDPRQRHHVRFWKYTDLDNENGENVWVGAATLDIGVKLSLYTGQFTHRVDADVDAERDYVIKTLADNGHLNQVKDFPSAGYTYESRNGGGDTFFTDGEIKVCSLA